MTAPLGLCHANIDWYIEQFGKLYQETTGASVVEVAHMEIAEPTIEQAIGESSSVVAVSRDSQEGSSMINSPP